MTEGRQERVMGDEVKGRTERFQAGQRFRSPPWGWWAISWRKGAGRGEPRSK